MGMSFALIVLVPGGTFSTAARMVVKMASVFRVQIVQLNAKNTIAVVERLWTVIVVTVQTVFLVLMVPALSNQAIATLVRTISTVAMVIVS